MGIMKILLGLFRSNRGKDNMWDFLGKRAAAKQRIELEELRNQGTREAMQSLKPGMVLREGGPDWFREIQVSAASPSPVMFTRAEPRMDLEGFAPAELEPSPPRPQEPQVNQAYE